MPQNMVEAARERQARLGSIVVLNENVEKLQMIVTSQGAEIRKDVGELKAKVDEALLIGTAMKASFTLIAGSIKRAAQALVVMAVVAVLFTASHSATAELVFHAGLEWIKHVVF